ncbi:50S ribosomal protein L23 [Candidatus Parcubacteria bacterium]|nr:MAG: 50S ribosomal protein L23 [Candidatus Parcubacteria bacterium]
MGLLDKWSKKKEQEQLEAVEKKATDVNVAEKPKAKKAATKKAAPAKKSDTKVTGIAYKTLVRPLVSEKATSLETQGKYVFVVHIDATKEEIKRSIEELYGVKPKRVRTMQFEGKRVRFGHRRGKRNDWKKAVVELPKGHTIHIHEGV